MAIGLKLGSGDTMEEKLRRFAVAREFRRRFEAEMGTINCSELTGMDLAGVDLIVDICSPLKYNDARPSSGYCCGPPKNLPPAGDDRL